MVPLKDIPILRGYWGGRRRLETILAGIRWTTLIESTVAFSGGSGVKAAPVPTLKASSTCPPPLQLDSRPESC